MYYASSAFKQVLVNYDPAVIQLATINQALIDAGYTHEMQVPVQEKLSEDSWKQGSFRMTQTNHGRPGHVRRVPQVLGTRTRRLMMANKANDTDH